MRTFKGLKRALFLTLALTLILSISAPALAYPLVPVSVHVDIVYYPGGDVYVYDQYGNRTDTRDFVNGTRITLRAVPRYGYEFVGWYDYNSGEQVGYESEYSLTLYTYDIALQARFEELDYPPQPITPITPPYPPVTPDPHPPIYPGVRPPGIAVLIGGRYVQYDVPPITEASRTLVPFRLTLEALNATVGWDDATQTVTATRGQIVVRLTVGENYAYVNGNAVALDVPARIVSDRTLVPLRFMAENLGFNADWNPQTQTITITQIAAIH